MLEILGEFFMDIFIYGTIETISQVLRKLPIHWNPKLLKACAIILGIIFWFFVGYVIIKLCEWILP